MKASERLRELRTTENEWPNSDAVFQVFEALPLIADVVEAAETEVPQLRQRVFERAMEQRERDGRGFAMDGSPTLNALTALTAALQPPETADERVRRVEKEWRDELGSPPPPEGATAPTKAPAVPIAELFNPYADDEGAALEGDTPR